MCSTERSPGLEEGEGGHGRNLTVCISDSEFNADSISNTNSHCICDPICDPIANTIANTIAKCDNSSRWLLRRKVE